jgi:hypothetical protein
MKKLLLSVTCLILASFAIAQNTKIQTCERNTRFGQAAICLPVVEGMKECYNDTIVKQIADGTEMKTNMVLGYYLTNADYNKRNTPEDMQMEEYFKVYSVKKLQDYTATANDLEIMQSAFEKSFAKDSWEEIVKKVAADYDSISIGVPTMIEKYKLDKSSVTYILLVKYSAGNKEDLKLLVMNLLFIKEKLVSLGFYKTYKNEQSLQTTKVANDSIITKFLAANQ